MNRRQRIYAWFRNHPGIVDAIQAFLLFTIFALGATSGSTSSQDSTAVPPATMLTVTLIESAGLTLPLAFRRIKPVLSGALMVFFALFAWTAYTLSPPGDGQLFPVPAAFVLYSVYSLSAYAPPWASKAGLYTALAGALMLSVSIVAVTSGWLYPDSPHSGTAPNPLFMFFLYLGFMVFGVLVSWLFGEQKRSGRLQIEAIQERAKRLEAEQEKERELTAADERARIAREIHDVVAHSLSVMIAQSDGGRYAGKQHPEQALTALETIGQTGRSALSDMRRVLNVLRSDDTRQETPLPTLEDIPDLINSVQNAGLHVDHSVSNDPPSSPFSLPHGADLTVYRVVQESLTNVLKHAGPNAHTEVNLTWKNTGFTPGLNITVQDDGAGKKSLITPSENGKGIQGMRERLALYNGTLVAAANPEGGFTVQAFIPYTEETL